MELRCLTSSRNASESFDLRCLVREEMTAWIQQNHPAAFPTMRLTGIPNKSKRLDTHQEALKPIQPRHVSKSKANQGEERDKDGKDGISRKNQRRQIL